MMMMMMIIMMMMVMMILMIMMMMMILMMMMMMMMMMITLAVQPSWVGKNVILQISMIILLLGEGKLCRSFHLGGIAAHGSCK